MTVERQVASRKFIGDVIWVGISQLFMSLTGIFVLPALTKSYPAEVYGLWSQMFVTVGFLRLLTIKFDSAVIRFLSAEDDKNRRRRAFGTMLWPILGAIILLIVLALLWQRSLSVFLFTDPQYQNFVLLVLLWASLEALFVFSLSYLRARHKIKRFSLLRLGSSVVRMLFIVGLALGGSSFEGVVISVIGVQTGFVTIVFAMVIRDMGLPSLKITGLKEYLKYSVPMLPGEVLYWIVNASDRYFITHFLNISQTGIYSASFAIANLLSLLSWPIGTVLFPAVSRLWEQGDTQKVKTYFQYSMKLFLTLALPAVAGIYVLSPSILRILATSEFVVEGPLVLLLAIGVVFIGIYLLNEYIIYLVKKTTWLPVINAIGAAINVVVNIILIPEIGILGAAVSTIVSYVLISVIITVWGRKMIPYSLDFIFIGKVVLATGAMTAAIWFIKVDGVAGIILVALMGTAVYAAGLYVLRAFSRLDRKIVREVFGGFRSRSEPD